MDLLGGYDSNSDSDNEGVTPPSVPQKPPPSASKKKPVSAKMKEPSNRKGKKLLKLQAFLPVHIWNQLSNGDAQQDSDEEDEERNPNHKTQRKPLTTNAPRQPGDTADMTNLLLALPKSKSGTGLLGNRSILGQDSSSTTIKAPSASSSLGSAFVTSTVETVRTKKSVPTVVKDIHDSIEHPTTEAVNDDADEETYSEEEAPKPPASSLPPVATSMPSVPRPRVPPPSSTSRARMAAPVIASRYQQPSYPTHSAAQQHLQQNPSTNNTKKSRKRQMEQMLRQGNLAGVSSDVHLHGQDNVYEVPQDQQQASNQSQGVRVVPTSQYNVGMGTTAASIAISGKQRGKNQMNSLLASAASLESQRARNPQTQQNVHRTNAKSKYGW
jgi:hypothetical protein